MGLVDMSLALRRVHINSKKELIVLIVMVVVYFAVDVAIQKLRPDMDQKKINRISVVIAAIIGLIILFAS